MVETSSSNAGAGSLIPDPGLRSHMPWGQNQNVKQKQYCNTFNKDFKDGPYQKKKEERKRKEIRVAWKIS